MDTDAVTRNKIRVPCIPADSTRVIIPSFGREEHLIPLMVCCGAGGAGKGSNIFSLKKKGEYPFSAFMIR